jgi:hypothetical protein
MSADPPEINDQQIQMYNDSGNTSLYDPSFASGRALPANTPLMEGGSQMIDALLNDDNVKESVRKRYFWVFGRDNSLTFLDEDRKASKMMAFDITKIDMLNNTSYYDYTFGEELDWGVMRNIFETKLDRSQGINESIKNERIIQQSQFSENRHINQNDDSDSSAREGFLKRLLKKR